MNNYDDTNPFADSTIRQATASSTANRQTNDYNPFANNTTPAEPAPPSQQPNSAAFLPSPQPAVYQPSAYTPVPIPEPVPQPPTTRVDVSDFERRQAELEARERTLVERERKLTNQELTGKRDNNFPPLPKFFPCSPCFYQDISMEIPTQFQRWVRYLFYIWIFYSFTLFLNMIAALSYFLTEGTPGAVTFGVSLLYIVLFIPAAYICWFRPIYRAFRNDSAVFFMLFFAIDAMFIVTNILFALGFIEGMCGFFLMIKVFASGGRKILVGFIMLIVTICFALLAIADSLILIQIHRLYRQTGATIEQAQKEFQTAFVNNPTVQGAAREVATAGINHALNSGGDQRVY